MNGERIVRLITEKLDAWFGAVVSKLPDLALAIVVPFPIRTLDFGIEGGATLAEMLPAGHGGAAGS